MTMSSSTLRSPSPKKQRKLRTESGSSTVSPCSREVRDLMATSSHSPSENQSETGASSSSPGCNTSAGISQILRGKLVQGAVISPSSGMIRTPTPGHPNYSPSSHLKSSYPRPQTRSASANSSEEITPPVEKSRKSSVTVAGADNKNKQVKRISVTEKVSKKSTNKSRPKKVSPRTEVKSAAKFLGKSLSLDSATKTSPRSPSKRKPQVEKSPVKKVAVKPDELVNPPKRDEVDNAEVTAADLGLELTDDGDGIEVELTKVEAEDLQEDAVEEQVKEEAEEVKGELVTKQEDTSSSSIGNINTSGESVKVKLPKSEKHKKKKKKSKEEKRDKEERRTEKRMERERRRTQERVQLLKMMSSESSLFGMENQNVFDVRHDD